MTYAMLGEETTGPKHEDITESEFTHKLDGNFATDSFLLLYIMRRFFMVLQIWKTYHAEPSARIRHSETRW